MKKLNTVSKKQLKELSKYSLIKQFVSVLRKPECKIILEENPLRHRHKIKDYKKNTGKRYPTFFTNEDINGSIEMKLKKPNFEHNGIRAELHGVIEKYSKINSSITEFTNLGIEILRPGKIEATSITIPFSFKNTKLEYESYKGLYAQVRYFIKIIINTNMLNYTYEKEFCAANPIDSVFLMEEDESIKMSVGLQNLLSLDFDLEHTNYNCRGTVKGIVSFNYIHLPIKYMEVQLLKNEVVFLDNKHEPIIIDSYELIDGSPVKKDKIPFRLFLNSYSLTPTYRNVGNVFSVKYYINLVIGDFENNTFFKRTEIKLFRVFKTKRNPDLNYGPFEEFISEPVYNEEYYYETKNKTEIDKNENNKNKNLNIFGNEEEEEDEEEEEEEDDENEEDEKGKDKNNDNIIDTSSPENKEKKKKRKKKDRRNSGIVSILRSNSLYKSEKFENSKNIINNINNYEIGNDNNNINIPFNDDDDDNNYMNTLITTNFPSQSNNQLFNNESNAINNINDEIISNSISNSKYGKIIKFDD